MSAEIQIGDIVQLASGSPRMTVFAIRKGRASVVWNHYPTGVVRDGNNTKCLNFSSMAAIISGQSQVLN